MPSRHKEVRLCPICGKHMYQTFDAAVRAINGRILHGGPPLRIYQDHGTFHITRQCKRGMPS